MCVKSLTYAVKPKMEYFSTTTVSFAFSSAAQGAHTGAHINHTAQISLNFRLLWRVFLSFCLSLPLYVTKPPIKLTELYVRSPDVADCVWTAGVFFFNSTPS